MAIPAQDMFRLFSGMIDEFLAIPDILNRIVTYKQAAAYADRPTQAILFLQQRGNLADPVIRHLRNHAPRPFEIHAAYEILEVAWILNDWGPQGPHAHMQAMNPEWPLWFDGGIDDISPMFHIIRQNFRLWDQHLRDTVGGQGTGWDVLIATARQWVLASVGAPVGQVGACHMPSDLEDFVLCSMYQAQDFDWWQDPWQ
jgi:hypothetical protein